MNRRTLLKRTAAGAAIGLTGGRSIRPAQAQAGWYEAEVIFWFTELEGESYSAITDGVATSVAGDGTIAGVDRADGKRVPVTWDLFGNRTILPTDGIDFVDARSVTTNKHGVIVGTLSTGEELGSPLVSVVWNGGDPVILQGSGTAVESIAAVAIADNGTIAGRVASSDRFEYVRWTDEIPEFLGDNEFSGLSKLSPTGNAYGSYLARDATRPTIWRWGVDGTVSTLPLPGELMADSIVKVPFARIMQAFDPDALVIDFLWNEGYGNVSGTWVYRNGGYQRARGTAQGLAMSADFAISPDLLLGDFVENGIGSGYGLLNNGAEMLLDTITALPGSFFLLQTIGVAEDGTIVMIGADDSVSSRPFGIIALRPVV